MVEWRTDRCDEERVPAFLMSTMNAVRFCEKMGFAFASELSLDVSLRDSKGHSIAQNYRELGMVYRPKER
jgi:succinate dehydrogenase/fumarate reductase flavoprotein subunit